MVRQFPLICKAMFVPLQRPYRASPIRAPWRLLAMLALLAAGLVPAFGQASNPSGLPLPRFASTRSEPINVRVGPGERYDIVWTYVRSGIPVEIIQEFDTWRKVRDMDGDEGWIHQNLLAGTRIGYVTPLVGGGEVPLRASNADEAGVRARLGPGLKVTITECDGSWCQVSATGGEAGARSSTYSGFLHQEELWGVYPDETFDD